MWQKILLTIKVNLKLRLNPSGGEVNCFLTRKCWKKEECLGCDRGSVGVWNWRGSLWVWNFENPSLKVNFMNGCALLGKLINSWFMACYGSAQLLLSSSVAKQPDIGWTEDPDSDNAVALWVGSRNYDARRLGESTPWRQIVPYKSRHPPRTTQPLPPKQLIPPPLSCFSRPKYDFNDEAITEEAVTGEWGTQERETIILGLRKLLQ